MLPKYLKKYFWEVDFTKLDARKHPGYVMERVLEYGDKKAVSWMLKNFSKKEIIDTLLKSRQLSTKSANFWALVFGVEKDKVLCLNEGFRKRQRVIWPY